MICYGLHTVFGFGKHKGKTLLQIVTADPTYIGWCLKNVKTFTIADAALKELMRINPRFLLSGVDARSILANKQEDDDSIKRDDPSYYEMMKHLHPRIANDPDAEKWIDLADDVGCDPATLRDNLD